MNIEEILANKGDRIARLTLRLAVAEVGFRELIECCDESDAEGFNLMPVECVRDICKEYLNRIKVDE